jgi:hypothetical protein
MTDTDSEISNDIMVRNDDDVLTTINVKKLVTDDNISLVSDTSEDLVRSFGNTPIHLNEEEDNEPIIPLIKQSLPPTQSKLDDDDGSILGLDLLKNDHKVKPFQPIRMPPPQNQIPIQKTELPKQPIVEKNEFIPKPQFTNTNNTNTNNTNTTNNLENEIEKKNELLFKIYKMQKKGIDFGRTYDTSDRIEILETAINNKLREKETETSVKFYRKLLLGLATGLEFLNTKFDPFGIKLDGWKDSLYDTIDEYDEVLEELHDKYKTKWKAPPEIRLVFALASSAFMFHLTSSMFKNTNIPGAEQIMKQNPELLKQFQNAAMNMTGMANPFQQQTQQNYQMKSPNLNSFLQNNTEELQLIEDDVMSFDSVSTSMTNATEKRIKLEEKKKGNKKVLSFKSN